MDLKTRQGVTWQDGVPFTAHDVAFTYDYIIKNNLAAFTSYTKDIENVGATDDTTVVFHLSKPKANMLRLWVPIVPEHVWSQVPGDKAGVSYESKPPLVGTGPFQVIEQKKGEYIVLQKNPHYWGKQAAVDQIVFQIYTNADTMAEDLRAGNIDYAQDLLPAQFKSMSRVPGITTNAASDRYFDEICMNCYDNAASLGNPVLRDPRFRQAISWAVDKPKILAIAYGGYGRVGQGIITPEIPVYYWTPPPDVAFGYDPAKAESMLDAAGYRDTNGDGIREHKGKPIVLRLWSRSEDQSSISTGKLVAAELRRVGIKITLQTMDEGAIDDALTAMHGNTYAPDYDMYIWGWGEYVDPDYILGVFTTAQIMTWNDCCWSNEQYDALYQQQAQELDQAKRKAIVDQMVQLFYQQAPYIVYHNEVQLEAFNTAKWEGWARVPTGIGPALFINDNIDTYLNLRLKGAATSGGGMPTSGWIGIGVVAAAIVAAVFVWLSRRRGEAPSEE